MPNEHFRYSKQISDQGRERSVEVRRERAVLKERLKAGEIAPKDVLDDEGSVAAKIRMFAFLKNCPGVGTVGARTLRWACPRPRRSAPWGPYRRRA